MGKCGAPPPHPRAQQHIYDVSIPVKPDCRWTQPRGRRRAALVPGGNGSHRNHCDMPGQRVTRGPDAMPMTSYRARGADDGGGFNESNGGVISWLSEGRLELQHEGPLGINQTISSRLPHSWWGQRYCQIKVLLRWNNRSQL